MLLGGFTLFLCVGPGSIRFYRLNHDVAGSVLKRCELNHRNIVAAGLEFQTAKPIGQIFGETIFQNAVFENRLMEVVFYLLKQFMLAARNAEDDLGVPRNRVNQCVIGCGVAGVQRWGCRINGNR